MSTFVKMTRQDIPQNFAEISKRLILEAMDAGGLARISAKGHVIVRNEAGATTWLSRNTGNGRKKANDVISDMRRMFPSIEIEDEVEEEATPSEKQKMCAKCKNHKDRDQFHNNKSAKDGLQSYCKDCMKIASQEAQARKQAQNGSTPSPAKPKAAKSGLDKSESVLQQMLTLDTPTAPEKPLTGWEAVQKLVAEELYNELTAVKAENERLRRALRKAASVLDNAIEGE
jgi:hypothetical protein